MNKLDPRLEGKTVRDITMKFVRDNLTEGDTLHVGKYAEKFYWKYPYSSSMEDTSTTILKKLEQSILGVLAKHEVIPSNDTKVEIEYESLGTYLHPFVENLRYRAVKQVPLDKVEYYQEYRKDQIKNANIQKGEWELYQKLKTKFEGDK